MNKGKGNDEDENGGADHRRNTDDSKDASSNQNDEDNSESNERDESNESNRRRRTSDSNDYKRDADRRTNNTHTSSSRDPSRTRKTKSTTTKLVHDNDHDCGKVRSISQQDGSTSTASITNLSSASSFGFASGGAWNPHHGGRRPRRRKPPSRNLYNAQLQLLATMTGGSFIAFLFFFLNVFAFASLMMGLASVILLMHTIYNYANFLLESGEGALFDFLPQNLQEYLTNTTIHDAMIDDSEFMENRWYLLYFIPGLSNEQRQALIDRLPQRHRDMAYGPGGMARMFLPDSIFRMVAPPNARSFSSSSTDHHPTRSRMPAIMADTSSLPSTRRIQNQSATINTSLALPVIDEGGDEDAQSRNVEEEDNITMQDAMQNLMHIARQMITGREETQRVHNTALDLNDLTLNHSPNSNSNRVELEVDFSNFDSDDESDLGIEMDVDDMVNGMNDGQLMRLARFVGLSSPPPANSSAPRIVPATPSSPETPYTPIRPRIMDAAAQDEAIHAHNLSNTFQRALNELQEESDNEVESIAEQTIEEQQELEGDIIMDAIGTMINHYTSQAADTALSVTNSIAESVVPPIIRFGTRLSSISAVGLLGIYSSTMQRPLQIMGRSFGGGGRTRTRTEESLFTGFALTLAFGAISAGSAYVARSITRSMMKSSKSNEDTKKPKDT